MQSHRSVFVSRAASAFSSLALTMVLAVLTILALALGTVQDSKAESNSGSSLLGLTKVEDPAFEWGSTSAASLPERSETAERLVIQVGAFTDEGKVREVRRKLEQAGLKTYTQTIEGKDGKRTTRIRLGPFDSRAEADKAAARVRKLDLPANLISL